MEFTPITKEEFPRYASSQGRSSPLSEIVSALEIGDGFSTPCIWEHRFYGGGVMPNNTRKNGHKYELCPGRNHIYQRGNWLRKQGGRHRLKTQCKDGTVYVIRIEDKEENHDN